MPFIFKQLKYFFINPFWRAWKILIFVILSFGANGLIWYLYLHRLQEFVNITPIYFALGVLILNIFLAVISYPKEPLMSHFLIGIGFLVQIIIIFFLSISYLSGGF